MHPYQNLWHLMHEYKQASDAMDDTGAFRLAMEIREAAGDLVILCAHNLDGVVHVRDVDPHFYATKN